MSDTTVGKIAVDIVGNANPLKKTVEGLGNALKVPLAKVGAQMAAAFSVAALAKFAKESIEAAAQVNAANSQMAQTFGDLENRAHGVFEKVARDSGILKTRLQGVGTSIYAFAKTSGMDSASAMAMMQDAIIATADSAAYYDRSLEDTAESLKSFLKGNYANDAALGISCTETTRNTAANKLYGKSFKELSEAQKQLTLLQMVKDANKLSGAMGQAAREADGWENVIGNLKESVRQLMAEVGKPMLQAATIVVKRLTEAIIRLTAYAREASSALSKLFGFAQDNSATGGISALASESENSAESLSDAVKAAEKLKKTVAGFDQLNILSSENDSSGSAEDSSDAGAALTMPDVTPAEKQTDNLKKKLETVFGTIKKIAKFTGITKLLDNIRREVKKIDFSSIADNFRTSAASMLPIAEQSLRSVLTIFRSYMGYIGALIGGTARTVSGILHTVSGGVAKWISQDNKKIAGFIADISGNVSGGINNITSFIQGFTDTLNVSFDRMRDRVQNSIADLLSGATTLVGSVGTILSAGFLTATSELNSWIDENGEALGNYYDNIQTVFSDAMSFVGEVFSDVGDTMLGWWNTGGGKEMWESFCGIVGDLGALFLKVFNQNIMPVWNTFVGMLRNAWQQHIQPILSKAMTTVSKLWNEILSPFWDNFLKPFLSWFADKFSARIQRQLKIVQDVFATVTGALGGYINAWLDKLNAVIDFVSAVFAGDWKKAWQAVQDYFKAEWDGIYSIAKGAINLIIDALNMLWTNIYDVAASIVDTLGGVSGAVSKVFGQDLSFSLPASIPTIPHLAAGGLVSAPTLALVGDNKGAATDPEVVAPLSKLQGLLGQTSDPQIIAMLNRIITLLENEESVYQNNFYLDSERIESKLVKVRRRKSRRYGGVTA